MGFVHKCLLALQGLVLLAQKKLTGEKLAEEEAKQNVKQVAKKEKYMIKSWLY